MSSSRPFDPFAPTNYVRVLNPQVRAGWGLGADGAMGPFWRQPVVKHTAKSLPGAEWHLHPGNPDLRHKSAEPLGQRLNNPFADMGTRNRKPHKVRELDHALLMNLRTNPYARWLPPVPPNENAELRAVVPLRPDGQACIVPGAFADCHAEYTPWPPECSH